MFRSLHTLVILAGVSVLAGTVSAAAQQPAPGAKPAGADLTIRGIENTIASLQQVGTKDALQAVLVLQLLRGMGQKGPSDDGRSRLDYHVTVTPDGKVLINDVDVSALANAIPKSAKGNRG